MLTRVQRTPYTYSFNGNGASIVVYVAVSVRSGCRSFHLFAIALDSVVVVVFVSAAVAAFITIAALKNLFNFDIEHIEFSV